MVHKSSLSDPNWGLSFSPASRGRCVPASLPPSLTNSPASLSCWSNCGLDDLHPLAAVAMCPEVKADLWLLTTEGKTSNMRRGNMRCVDFYLWCIKNYILGKRGWFSKETQSSPFSNGNSVSPLIFLFKIQFYWGIVVQLYVLAYAYACENPSPQSGAPPLPL